MIAALRLSPSRAAVAGAVLLVAAGAGCSRTLQQPDDGSAGGGGAGGSGGGLLGTGGGAIGPNCGARNVRATRESPAIVLVVGRSASMRNDAVGSDCGGDCGATSRWAELSGAIADVVTAAPAGIAWGLELYPSPGTDGCGVASESEIDVPVGSSNGAAVLAALAQVSPAGGRAVRAAVEATTLHLIRSTEPRAAYLVLVTDGVPGCANDGGPTGDDLAGALGAVTWARGSGFPTFVLGVATRGDAAAESALSMLAVEGGAHSGVSYRASRAGLAEALDAIVRPVASCVFATPRPPTDDGTTSRSAIDVSAGGSLIPRDMTHANGWDFLDPSLDYFQVFGPPCDAAQAGALGDVTVTFRCFFI